MYKIFLSSVAITFCIAIVAAQNQNQDDARCFRFTWLGPRFNNESIFMNATCRDATRLASGVPCEMPLVVSYDRTWPDVEYIWTHHRENATCKAADSDVCAQYTYYFNGQVVNSTYMCTKAIDANNTAITSGCFQEDDGSFSTRVCVCRSVPGGFPCNSASLHLITPFMAVIFVISLIRKSYVGEV